MSAAAGVKQTGTTATAAITAMEGTIAIKIGTAIRSGTRTGTKTETGAGITVTGTATKSVSAAPSGVRAARVAKSRERRVRRPLRMRSSRQQSAGAERMELLTAAVGSRRASQATSRRRLALPPRLLQQGVPLG